MGSDEMIGKSTSVEHSDQAEFLRVPEADIVDWLSESEEGERALIAAQARCAILIISGLADWMRWA